MTKGINRAYQKENYEINSFSGTCVFISHKYEDLCAAREAANYITDYGIDVYLDDRDFKLQKAVNACDSAEIVSCIEAGLNRSSHILVLVTENTRISWWVPYETGYAKRGSKGIASLLLKKADNFPDYLKIETTLNGFGDLTKFLENLPELKPVTESAAFDFERSRIQDEHRDALLKYIRE